MTVPAPKLRVVRSRALPQAAALLLLAGAAPALAQATPPDVNGVRFINARALHVMGWQGQGTAALVEWRTAPNGPRPESGIVQASHTGLPSVVNYDYDQGRTGPFITSTLQNAGQHATNVAGVLAGPSAGAMGAAPNVSIACGRVSSEPDIINAAADLSAYPVSVINHAARGYRFFNASLRVAVPANGARQAPRALDWMISKQNLVWVTAAGNSGSPWFPGVGSLGVPADIYNGITVGALNRVASPGRGPAFAGVANFSSRGPTGDMRAKPDIVAPGVGIRTTNIGANSPLTGPGTGQQPDPNGTSLSAPLVTGAAMVLEQMAGAANSHPRQNETRYEAQHHLSIKSAMLTGANKPVGWATPGGTAQPLDYNFGAGELNVRAAAASLMRPGKPGDEPNTSAGHDLGRTTKDGGGIGYTLPLAGTPNGLRQGNVVISTLTWDRTLRRAQRGSNTSLTDDAFVPHGTRPTNPDDTPGDVRLTPVRDLNLELRGWNGGALVAQSNSPRDNVEHLMHTVTAADVDRNTAGLYVRVVDPGSAVTGDGSLPFRSSQEFGVSWRTAPNLVAARGKNDLAEFGAGTIDFHAGAHPNVFSPFGSSPTGLALSPFDTDTQGGTPWLFAGDTVQNRVRVFDYNGVEVTPLGDTIAMPRDLAFNRAGELLVTSDLPGTSDAVLRVDPHTGQVIAPLVSGVQGASGIALDARDRVWITESESGMVREFLQGGRERSSFAIDAGLSPVDLAFDVFGSLWVLADTGGVEDALVLRYNPDDGSLLDAFTAPGVFDPRALAINPFDGDVYVSGQTSIVSLSASGDLTLELGSSYLIDNGGGLVFTQFETPGRVPAPATLALALGLGLGAARRRRDEPGRR